MNKKVAITCAITGSLSQRGNGKGQTPYLPVTPDEIAQDAKRAYDAGAAIVHLHARDPETGLPTADLDIFSQCVEKTRSIAPELIINTTTGGGTGMTDEERIGIVFKANPDMASFNMGSLVYGMANPSGGWLMDVPFINTFASMEYFGNTMTSLDVKPELECYDIGMINNAMILFEAGVLKSPMHFQFVMGLPGQVIPATAKNLIHMVETLKSLSLDCTWSVAAAGRSQFPMVTLGAILGADNVRTGMEDNIYISKGKLCANNGELVEKTVRLCKDVGREIASPAEAREILGIPRKK